MISDRTDPGLLSTDGPITYYRVQSTDGERFQIARSSEADENHYASRLLDHEFDLRLHIDSAWAFRPIVRERTQQGSALRYGDEAGMSLASQPFSTADADHVLTCMVGIALALKLMHGHGLIHRNIKPANIFITEDGACRFRGFGVACFANADSVLDVTSLAVGSNAYTAPESISSGAHVVDVRADLYSVGIVLYEMLHGALPNGKSATESDVSPTSPSLLIALSGLRPIIDKLLALNPIERYQTAKGLHADLTRCLTSFHTTTKIAPFDLGMRDGGSHLRYSSTLYARGNDLVRLHAAHHSACAHEEAALVLINGPTGIGKSALAQAFERRATQEGHLIAAGKADQFRREIPYSALIEAFNYAVRRILTLAPQQQDYWRDRIASVLASFIGLALKVVPELQRLIDNPVETDQFSVEQAEARLFQVFHALCRALSEPGRPLILILDDVHWLDEATHHVLHSLTTSTPPQSLFLIALLRDNKVSEDTELRFHIGKLKAALPDAVELTLQGLDQPALIDLISESMSLSTDDLPALSQSVLDSTQGNPLLVRTLLSAISEDGDIARTRHSGMSHLDIAQIRSRHFVSDILHVIDERIQRMPEGTRQLLAAMAWLGGTVELDLLSLAEDHSMAEVVIRMAPAVEAGLVRTSGQRYTFSHDQIQSSAHALFSPAAKLAFHLRVGLLLSENATATGRDDVLFRAAEHLLHARTQLNEPHERMLLGETVLKAAVQAKRAIAYATAIDYLDKVLTHLMPADCLTFNSLLFALRLERAECEFHRGHLVTATQQVKVLLSLAFTDVQRASTYRLKADIRFRRFEIEGGITSALQGLAALDIVISPHPTEAECLVNYERVVTRLPVTALPSLSELAPMQDARMIEAMNLLCTLLSPSGLIRSRLQFTVTCVALRLTLDHGMSGPATTALAWFGALYAHKLDQYETGYRYTHSARHLVAANRYVTEDAKTLLPLAHVSVWTQPLTVALETARKGFTVAVANGDEAVASIACYHIVSMLLAQGVHLGIVRQEVERGLRFVDRVGFSEVRAILSDQLRFIDNIRGNFQADYTAGEYESYDNHFLSTVTQVHVDDTYVDGMAMSHFNRYLFQAMTHLMHGQAQQSLVSLRYAADYAWSVPGHLPLFALEIFNLLAESATCGNEPPSSEQAKRMADSFAKIGVWAQANPATFGDKHMLATAEMQRAQGETTLALASYERAAQLSNDNGFPHYAALAYDRAASLCATLNHHVAGRAYARASREGYSKWGASGKVSLIDSSYPDVRQQVSLSASADEEVWNMQGTVGVTGLLDAARALSEEVVLDLLIHKLMATALNLADASAGTLIRVVGGLTTIEARAQRLADTGALEVTMLDMAPTAEHLPMSVLNTALRTQRRVVVDASDGTNPFVYDDYLRRRPGYTVVCLPLLKRNEPVGALYLEIDANRPALQPTQEQVLEMLAAQAAISLETARFRAELLEESAQRRKVEHALRMGESSLAMAEQISHTGSWRWDLRTNELICSEEYRRIFGLDPRRSTVPFAQYMACIHPDDQKIVEDSVRAALETRSTMRADYRIIRADGSIRYISGVGKLAVHPGDHIEYIGTVADITRQREADEALRTSQADLARVSRANTVGQLTASIAHELNQPLTSIVSNAGASVRWLNRIEPNLDAVREGLNDIEQEAQRAGDMIRSLLALTRNAEPSFALVDMHEMAHYILKLSRRDLEKKLVRLELDLSAQHSVVHGDAVQLQQVLLNFVVNAIDAMSEIDSRPRVLRVVSHNDEGSLIMCVEDNGIGIQPEHMPRLFDAFYTTKATGMGMGLAICQSILKAHSGNLAAHHLQPYGSSFCMRLSLSERTAS